MIDLKIQQSDAFERLEKSLQESALVESRNAAGEEATTKLQDHFADLNQRPNKKGWPKRGFWAEVLKTVGANPTTAAYEISVANPAFWRRWKGGDPIIPKTGPKRLAIPAIAEAYAAGRPAAGRVPVELMLIFRGRGRLALAEKLAPKPGSTRPQAGRIWYWLVKSANPGPDPAAAPDIAAIAQSARTTVDSYLSAIARQYTTRPA